MKKFTISCWTQSARIIWILRWRAQLAGLWSRQSRLDIIDDEVAWKKEQKKRNRIFDARYKRSFRRQRKQVLQECSFNGAPITMSWGCYKYICQWVDSASCLQGRSHWTLRTLNQSSFDNFSRKSLWVFIKFHFATKPNVILSLIFRCDEKHFTNIPTATFIVISRGEKWGIFMSVGFSISTHNNWQWLFKCPKLPVHSKSVIQSIDWNPN